VAGIAWRRVGQVVLNPARPPLADLDAYPIAWDLVDDWGFPTTSRAGADTMSDESKPEPTAQDPAETASLGISGSIRGVPPAKFTARYAENSSGGGPGHPPNLPAIPEWAEDLTGTGEMTGGIIVGELASRLAQAHRRRRGRQKPR
jgi:hypothetical protein